MDIEDVKEYVRCKLDVFTPNCELQCEEIGDGNLNYVFRVRDVNSGISVIVKQAGVTARISDEFKLSTDRNRIESEVLLLQDKLAPGLVPKVLQYDDVMSCCVMEDLSSYTILRTALTDEQRIFPLFADHITTFMANTLLLSSDVVMNHKDKKAAAAAFSNPELCEITEDLVYSEPFKNHNSRNDVFAPNEHFVEKEIYGDDELRLEAAKLKFQFMTNAQALLHGDLHTGSIFVTEKETKVIDPEFAFYGPMGYDIGNVIANLMFAWSHATAVNARTEYVQWLEQTIVDVVDLFRTKFTALWDASVQDVMAKEPGFRAYYLQNVMADSAAVAGLELIRRIVGLAGVKDISSIADEHDRIAAERVLLTAAKRLIKNRNEFEAGADYIGALKQAQHDVNWKTGRENDEQTSHIDYMGR
ncbi:S-methyl-5-thioribose kinase [Fictibacillus iocasae]|uniref:S-methyl-5-thioribose kinase n=1 Tax=Fictibacillus iocasae TaxID=2715437 RepID=A0ABW2NN82_9BACL